MKHQPIDPKTPRPTKRSEAISLIAETFSSAGNNWSDREQAVFLKSLGLSGDWKTFGNDDLKTILNELERLKMVIFK